MAVCGFSVGFMGLRKVFLGIVKVGRTREMTVPLVGDGSGLVP